MKRKKKKEKSDEDQGIYIVSKDLSSNTNFEEKKSHFMVEKSGRHHFKYSRLMWNLIELNQSKSRAIW